MNQENYDGTTVPKFYEFEYGKDWKEVHSAVRCFVKPSIYVHVDPLEPDGKTLTIAVDLDWRDKVLSPTSPKL